MTTKMQQPTVLVIEEDPKMREGLATLLRVRARVLQASTLAEATDMVERHAPEVLVVNGELPDGNGIEWISMRRSEGSGAQVIFISSYFGQPRWTHVLARLGVRRRFNTRTSSVREIADSILDVIPGSFQGPVN